MAAVHTPLTAPIVENPVYAAFAPFPAVCFTLALLTDVAYWMTGVLFWQECAEWLLLAGLVGGGLAALAAFIELLSRSAIRRNGFAWLHWIGSLVVLALAFVNSLVHARDGWTGVVPMGLALSAATVALLLINASLGRSMVHRHATGARADG